MKAPTNPAERKMMELMIPTFHSSAPTPSIPRAVGKERLAPLDPV